MIRRRLRARTIAPVIALFFGLLGSLAAGASSGCIIAESPSDLPVRPASPPHIIQASAVPPPPVLRSFPDEFIVPVELEDPDLTFEIRAFVDFDLNNGAMPAFDELSTATPASADAGIRFFSVQVTPPADLSRCHTIEIDVATGWRGELGQSGSHTPDQNGGDSIVWLYAPEGPGNCPTYDPNVDASTVP